MHKIIISTSPWSDHDPLVLGITLTVLTHPAYLRRINESLLTTQDTCIQVQIHIQTYFTENVGSVESLVSLREAHKATVRGN